MCSGKTSDFCGWMYYPALAGHVGQGDQADVVADGSCQVFKADAALRVVRNDLDAQVLRTCHMQKRQVVAGVLGLPG